MGDIRPHGENIQCNIAHFFLISFEYTDFYSHFRTRIFARTGFQNEAIEVNEWQASKYLSSFFQPQFSYASQFSKVVLSGSFGRSFTSNCSYMPLPSYVLETQLVRFHIKLCSSIKSIHFSSEFSKSTVLKWLSSLEEIDSIKLQSLCPIIMLSNCTFHCLFFS